MIALLEGTVFYKNNNNLIIKVNGVGYEVEATEGLLNSVNINDSITVYTYQLVRDDKISLFGFAKIEEKILFLLLTKVNSVGPKLAIAILSNLGFEVTIHAIAQGNKSLLQSVNGLGKKTVEKIIIELQDKIDKVLLTNKLDKKMIVDDANQLTKFNVNDSISALQNLGYSKAIANDAIIKIPDYQNKNLSELIKLGLKNINGSK